MGIKSRLALTFTSLSTLSFILAMATPWWYIQPLGQNKALCFIDGTCRNGSSVFKNNGNGQQIFDATMVLMILAWIPFISFFHLMLRRRRHLEGFTGRSSPILFTHLISWLLILSAVVTFPVGLVSVLNLGHLYGEANEFFPQSYSWGAHVGWYFAIFTLVLLVPALVFSLAISSTKKYAKKLVNDSSHLLPHTAVRPGYQAIPQPVTTL